MTIHRLQQWVIEIWRWLAEAEIVIMCLLVIVAVVALGFGTWRTPVSIRSAGYVLQLAGMIFAIIGLLSIRKHFGQTLLRKLLWNWLKRFPKWKRSTVVGAGAVNVALAGVKARAEVGSPDVLDQSLEKRIADIVRNLETIRNEQCEHAKSIEELKNSHEEHKTKDEEQTKKMKKEIQSDSELLHTSDLMASLAGLVWLTVGITMSTMAPELSKWLH